MHPNRGTPCRRSAPARTTVPRPTRATTLRPPLPASRVEAPGVANLFVVRDGLARITRVQLGTMHGGVVEVRGGLEEAAVLVANPPFGLENMHRVTAKR